MSFRAACHIKILYDAIFCKCLLPSGCASAAFTRNVREAMTISRFRGRHMKRGRVKGEWLKARFRL